MEYSATLDDDVGVFQQVLRVERPDVAFAGAEHEVVVQDGGSPLTGIVLIRTALRC
jgi:hypothetical protein